MRIGGDYQITLSGTVSYGSERANGDPVVGTYSSYYGACKFLIAGLHYSEQLVSGRGLVDTSDPTIIRFQALR